MQKFYFQTVSEGLGISSRPCSMHSQQSLGSYCTELLGYLKWCFLHVTCKVMTEQLKQLTLWP